MKRNIRVGTLLALSMTVSTVAADVGITDIRRTNGPLADHDFSNNETFSVRIENSGETELMDTPLTIAIHGPNGDVSVAASIPTIAANSHALYPLSETFDLYAQGEYNVTITLTSITTVSGDNEKATVTARSLSGATLPLYEGFESVGPTLRFVGTADAGAINGLSGWSYRPELTSERLRFSQTAIPTSGRAATFDSGNFGDNAMVLTVDASAFTTSGPDDIFLDMTYFNVFDENGNCDKFYVRGTPENDWVEIHHWNTGVFDKWIGFTANISDFLADADQNFSAKTQFKFQQCDNFSIPTDGLIIDNIFVGSMNQNGSTSPLPGDLRAEMVESQKITDHRDETGYFVHVLNSPDGGHTMEDVVFEMTTFDHGSSLIPGSVFTTRGSVITGNAEGDATIRIEIGDLADGDTANIGFSARIDRNLTATVRNQGRVSATNIATFSTDDPRDESSFADPTVTIVGDFDLVPAITESLVPSLGSASTGDGNGDAIQDHTQDGVISFWLINTSLSATLVIHSGQPLTSLEMSTMAEEQPDTMPGGVTGSGTIIMATLETFGESPEESFELYLPQEAPVNALYVENQNTGSWDRLAGATTVSNKRKLAFNLTDGGEYDIDGETGNGLTMKILTAEEPTSSQPAPSIRPPKLIDWGGTVTGLWLGILSLLYLRSGKAFRGQRRKMLTNIG